MGIQVDLLLFIYAMKHKILYVHCSFRGFSGIYYCLKNLPIYTLFSFILKSKICFKATASYLSSPTHSPRVQCGGGLFVPIIPSLAFDDDLDPGQSTTARPDTVSPPRERCGDGAAVHNEGSN